MSRNTSAFPRPHASSPALALAPFELHELDNDTATICVVDRELHIAWVNRAWRRFAHEGGGTWQDERWSRGSTILDAVPPLLRPFYDALFDRAFRTNAPVDHLYECSSPSAYRRFCMRLLPCEAGLVIAHSLLLEAPHAGIASEAIELSYRDANGIVCQCSHCRRVRRAGSGLEAWDWVPDYVARVPPMTSHGLCSLCLQYFYPA